MYTSDTDAISKHTLNCFIWSPSTSTFHCWNVMPLVCVECRHYWDACFYSHTMQSCHASHSPYHSLPLCSSISNDWSNYQKFGTQYSVVSTDTIAELYDRFSFISDRFCKCSLIVGFPLVSRFNSVIKRSQSKDTGANGWVLVLKLTIKSRVHCCHENLNNNLLSD